MGFKRLEIKRHDKHNKSQQKLEEDKNVLSIATSLLILTHITCMV